MAGAERSGGTLRRLVTALALLAALGSLVLTLTAQLVTRRRQRRRRAERRSTLFPPVPRRPSS